MDLSSTTRTSTYRSGASPCPFSALRGEVARLRLCAVVSALGVASEALRHLDVIRVGSTALRYFQIVDDDFSDLTLNKGSEAT